MKSTKNIFSKSNVHQLIQIAKLIILIIIPWVIKVNIFWITKYIPFFSRLNDVSIEANFESILINLFLYGGNVIESIILAVFWLAHIRRQNSSYVMNNSNEYHDYPLIWYWICAKLLGIKSCNLILTPIHMQYTLIINEIFEKYPLDERAFPTVECQREYAVEEKNMIDNPIEINLILEDTYTIDANQIPEDKRLLPTISIKRIERNSHTRNFRPELVRHVVEIVRRLPEIENINIFATTNPMNNLRIARDAFYLADRGNIKHLYVYQQGKENDRKFEEKGYKIY